MVSTRSVCQGNSKGCRVRIVPPHTCDYKSEPRCLLPLFPPHLGLETGLLLSIQLFPHELGTKPFMPPKTQRVLIPPLGKHTSVQLLCVIPTHEHL